MGERNTSHKETKKKKKTDATAPALSTYERPVMTQPELIKKRKDTETTKRSK